jgi:hypothetical protein
MVSKAKCLIRLISRIWDQTDKVSFGYAAVRMILERLFNNSQGRLVYEQCWTFSVRARSDFRSCAHYSS